MFICNKRIFLCASAPLPGVWCLDPDLTWQTFQMKRRQQRAQKLYYSPQVTEKEVPVACTSCKLAVERDAQTRLGTQLARNHEDVVKDSRSDNASLETCACSLFCITLRYTCCIYTDANFESVLGTDGHIIGNRFTILFLQWLWLLSFQGPLTSDSRTHKKRVPFISALSEL
jgi:hypothetical protein